MVATRSGKAKFTYAERVLGAFSQLQKEHRRRSIHLASLRAQVKKTAQAKKDILGPQWSSWVGKTVHKLEDEGLLAPSEPSGSITLTPNGKRAISIARRNLLISTHATPSPAQEEEIWKQVSQVSGGRSLKRKKPSRLGDGHDESGEQDEGILPSLMSYNTRSKRARLSSVGKKAVHNMTKIELTAELKSLQRALAQSAANLERSQQSETGETNAEEINTLRDELKQRQSEIDAVRTELAEVKRLAAGADNISTQLGASSPGPMDFPSSPIRTGTPARARLLTGIISTQSGSHISLLSKQPTPAPSSPGATDHDGDMTFGTDNNTGVFGDASNIDDLFNSPSGRNGGGTGNMGVLTTHETPGRSMKEIMLEEEMEKYKSLVTEVKKKADERDALAHEKFESLEQALTARNGELRLFETTLSALRSEHSECQLSISERDERVTELQAEVQTLRQDVTSQNAMILVKDTQLADIQRTKNAQVSELELVKATLEDSFASKKAELEAIIEERNNSITSLLSENSSFVEQLRVIKEANASLETQLANAIDQKYEIDAALAKARVSIEELHVRLQVEVGALAASKSVVVNLQDQLSRSQRDAQDLRNEISVLNASVQSLQATVQSSGVVNDGLRDELRMAIDRGVGLNSSLENKERQYNELAAWKEGARTSISVLQEEVAKTRETAASLRKEVGAVTAQLTTSRQGNESLSMKLEAKEGQRESLAQMLSVSEGVGDGLRAEVAEGKKEIQSLRATLESAEHRIQDLQVTLDAIRTDLHTKTTDAESTISVLRTALATAQSDVDTSKTDLDTLVATHSQTKAELGESRSELARTLDILKVANGRVATLEHDTAEVLERLREATEEVLDLQTARKVDTVTIERLKEEFTRMRKIQVQLLTELDNKILSAQLSPVCKGRGPSKNPARIQA